MTEPIIQRDRGTLIVGTIFSVPIFLVCFFVVAIVTHVIYVFFLSVQGGEINRLVQLGAAVVSSICGVISARWICDKAFKEWSGWPVFVLLIVLTIVSMGYAVYDTETALWDKALQLIQMTAAIGATWVYAVKKDGLD